MKNIGKPCAGKPHARFDEGALRKDSARGHVVAACGEASFQKGPETTILISALLYPIVHIVQKANSYHRL
jgi:hypothetical protein